MRALSVIRTGVLVLVASVCANAQDPTGIPQSGTPQPDADSTPGELPAEGAAELPTAEPWDGTFAGGVGEAVRLAASDDPASAIKVCDRLLSPDTYGRWRTSLEEWSGGWSERMLGAVDQPLVWLGFEALTERDRAEVRYLRGLLRNRVGAVLSANEEFELARVLAGAGATRRDAIYALGTLDLEQGEFYRLKIPEISGVPPTPPAGPPAGPPGGDEEPPDSLQVARAFYMEAREHFVERLRTDWRDSDTRANVELVQRRLAELDQIERDREQEQQDQEQSQEPNEDQQEAPDEAGENQEQEPQEGEQEPEEQEPSEDEQDPSEESEEGEQEGEEEERALTEEEMKRLLQMLREYNEQGEQLERNLRALRRERVKKDW